MMELIVDMRFGSHLYGTATPQSDLDYKSVYVPPARDILLQQVRETLATRPQKADGVRNLAGDVDREIYSLRRYLQLLAEGQTVALDMLFAPESALTRAPSPLWRTIQENRARLVSRRSAAFVGYCRQQANRFSAKGTRVAEARRALAMLAAAEAAHGTTAKLEMVADELQTLVSGAEHMALVDLPTVSGRVIRHLEICGRKTPFPSTIKLARESAARQVEAYGQRALEAERNEGADWKALSHAVRIGRQAVELFETGHITLPLPYADDILAIKRGERPYAAVADSIERLLATVEAAAAASTLPEAPDQAFIDDLVVAAYRAKILEAA